MSPFITSLRMLILFTALTGVAYPALITLLGGTIFPRQAAGSLLRIDQQVIGSVLIAQPFSDAGDFWPRPSAVSHVPQPSGGSNAGMISKALATQIADRRTAWSDSNPGIAAPDELLQASGSGLDPHISPATALAQLPRIAAARHWTPAQHAAAAQQITAATHGRTVGIIGEPRVNVLQLNLALRSGTFLR